MMKSLFTKLKRTIFIYSHIPTTVTAINKLGGNKDVIKRGAYQAITAGSREEH